MFVPFAFPSEDVSDASWVDSLGLNPPRELPNVDLRNPQLLALHFAKDRPRIILSLDKGMGKTLTYLLMAEASGREKILILCTSNAFLTQKAHINKFFPQWAGRVSFIRGTAAQRKKAWNDPLAKVFVATFATWLSDVGARAGSSKIPNAPSWAVHMSGRDGPFVICDEYHKVLRNKGTKMHKALKAANPDRLVLSSGSVANKGAHSVWTALNLCAPTVWSSYWKYVHTFCEVNDTRWGKQIGGVKNVKGWRNSVSPYIFHRRKNAEDYPPKTRQLLRVEMEPWQKKIHNELQKDLLVWLRGGESAIIAKNPLDATHKLRQFMICPKALDESLGWGCYLEGVADDFETSELTHAVISTPFIKPIEYIAAYLQSRNHSTYVLKGGMSMEEVEDTIKRFRANGGIIIQSIKFAESYELWPAHYMYMLGYDYNPEQNAQAEDRIHRDKAVTPDPVDIYYTIAEGAYDERVLDELAFNADNVWALLDKPASQLADLFGR